MLRCPYKNMWPLSMVLKSSASAPTLCKEKEKCGNIYLSQWF